MGVQDMPGIWLDFEQMISSAPGLAAKADVKFAWGPQDYSQWFSMYGIWVWSVLEARHADGCKAKSHSTGAQIRGCFAAAQPNKRDWVEAHWGVRCAFTHSDGDVSILTSSKRLARSAPQYVPGVTLTTDRILLTRGYLHDARQLLYEGLAHIYQR